MYFGIFSRGRRRTGNTNVDFNFIRKQPSPEIENIPNVNSLSLSNADRCSVFKSLLC